MIGIVSRGKGCARKDAPGTYKFDQHIFCAEDCDTYLPFWGPIDQF